MNIEIRNEGAGISVMGLSGKITLKNGNIFKLRTGIQNQLRVGNNKIVLNLSCVEYIDSTGIGELVSSLTLVVNQGGKLVLVNPTQKINELLMITKLISCFQIFSNEPEAIASLK